ncbi:HAMP domain-containing sensor histidine kinase [Bacillus sp. 1P10SD]|uniref:sensor histidine kinase n=1 Tax=Bacillus sp. 1P10SD TaxID=3132265 RepID=UPI0039A77445
MLFLYITLSLIISIMVFILFHSYSKIRKLRNQLKKSERNYQDLTEKYNLKNQKFERRIQEELEKNKQKDLLLIRHSRFAAMGEMISSRGQQWLQPLNSLSLLIQDVREAREFGEIDDQYINRFTVEGLAQINVMSGIVNDLRKFYQQNTEKSFFSVGDSIEDALTMFSSSLKNHNIQVSFEYRGQHIGYGYPNEFSQVMVILFSIFRDIFVDKNIKKRKLVIKLQESKECVIVEVFENSGDIYPAHIQKIFDPYFSIRSDESGLDHYIAKMILEKMDGRISVENTIDGAKFHISLPKCAVSTEREAVSV